MKKTEKGGIVNAYHPIVEQGALVFYLEYRRYQLDAAKVN